MSTTPESPRPGEEKLPPQPIQDKPLDREISDLTSEAVGPLWNKLGITTAVILAKVPNTDKVAIYYRGHFYDVTTLLSAVGRKFLDQIDRELGR